MKIAYVTNYNIRSSEIPKKHFSRFRIAKFISSQLEQFGVNIEYVCPIVETKWPRPKIIQMKEFLYSKLGLKYMPEVSKSILKDYANQVSERISGKYIDIILIFPNFKPIACLKTDIPIILWQDAPFASLIDNYIPNLCNETKKDIYSMEKLAYSQCSKLIFCSEWAAEEAKRFYNIDSSKISVLPFGANFESGFDYPSALNVINKREYNVCRLLFVGIDWERKGGDLSLEITKILNEEGLKTELTIVGCNPEIPPKIRRFVNIEGFLNPYDKECDIKLRQLFSKAHFLIHPPKFDFTPRVLCEANSFAVPVLANRIGGISSIISEGVNGHLFLPNSQPSEYAKVIKSYMKNQKSYKAFAMSSFKEYTKRLNWHNSMKKFIKLMETLKEKG